MAEERRTQDDNMSGWGGRAREHAAEGPVDRDPPNEAYAGSEPAASREGAASSPESDLTAPAANPAEPSDVDDPDRNPATGTDGTRANF